MKYQEIKRSATSIQISRIQNIMISLSVKLHLTGYFTRPSKYFHGEIDCIIVF